MFTAKHKRQVFCLKGFVDIVEPRLLGFVKRRSESDVRHVVRKAVLGTEFFPIQMPIMKVCAFEFEHEITFVIVPSPPFDFFGRCVKVVGPLSEKGTHFHDMRCRVATVDESAVHIFLRRNFLNAKFGQACAQSGKAPNGPYASIQAAPATVTIGDSHDYLSTLG